MRQPLKRISPRDNLCTTDDGEAIQHLQRPMVVWRYERMRKNVAAQSIPFVDVMFKFLDQHDEPQDFIMIPIGISRLASFRLGTIWQNGKCIAETDLGDDHYFTIDCTVGKWTHVSFPSSTLGSIEDADVLTDFLSFTVAEGTVLIPCIEFLVRGYGSTPDIARILATHPWPKVQDDLYDSIDLNYETWLVKPARNVHDDDALLLASMLYDPYAELAAKEIYAQLDNAHGSEMKAASLRVKPWFQGPAKIRVRGRWMENLETFVCCEITGMSQPQSHIYDISRPKYSKEDPHGEAVTEINRARIEVPKAQDGFKITDLLEPDRGAAEWRKPDPGFEIIGPRCRFTRSTEERTYAEKKSVRPNPSDTTTFSTGDKVGGNNGVGKVRHCAKRFIGDGGVLSAMWTELTRLKDAQPFTSLHWYSNHQFYDEAAFRLQALPAFHDDDSPDDEVRRWLAFKDNAARVRGILVVRIVINCRSFYLFEAQRKQKRNGAAYEEETSYGLLMEISDPASALVEISNVCDKIRFCKGKFRALEDLKFPHWAFRHITRNGVFYANATLRSAFFRMNVKLKRLEPDLVPGPSE